MFKWKGMISQANNKEAMANKKDKHGFRFSFRAFILSIAYPLDNR
jgi:hypothetical protein